jgi:hypothetical protein
MWQAAVFVVWSAYPSGACCGPANCNHAAIDGPRTSHVSSSARVSDSQNFHIVSYSVACDARKMAQCCESWRQHLQAKWLSADAGATWTPRCEIVVHPRRETYGAAIGRGGDQTFGSSFIDVQNGRISKRRIDLLIDAQGKISALGHELTHVVLADAFPGTRPPAWANEGAAVLADSAEKQRLHKRDLAQSFHHRTAFHCAELMQTADYPAPHRIAAFYGQSASLTALLADIGGPEKFVPFLKQASSDGYDKALRDCYGIQGLTDLQRRYNEHQNGHPASSHVAAAN